MTWVSPHTPVWSGDFCLFAQPGSLVPTVRQSSSKHVCPCVYVRVDGHVLYADDWSAVSLLCQERRGIPRSGDLSGNTVPVVTGHRHLAPSKGLPLLLFLLFPPSLSFGPVCVPDSPGSLLPLSHYILKTSPARKWKACKTLHYVDL